MLWNYTSKTLEQLTFDWEECFTNKTVEAYIFLSLRSYFLNIDVNYILNKTVDGKDPLLMSGWKKNLAIKWKNSAYCKEYVRSGDTLLDTLTYLKRLLLPIWLLIS